MPDSNQKEEEALKRLGHEVRKGADKVAPMTQAERDAIKRTTEQQWEARQTKARQNLDQQSKATQEEATRKTKQKESQKKDQSQDQGPEQGR